MLKCWVLAGFTVLATGIGIAAPIVIDFDSLNDGDAVTTQYPGIVFTNTTVLTAGISLNEFEFPPLSGANVASDDGGPISISFLTPTQSFAGYFTYLMPVVIRAFDTGNNEVDSINSLFSNNLALSGEFGSLPNELLQVSFAGGISRVEIAGSPVGGSFTLDNAVLDSTVVPEPDSVLLVIAGGALLAGFRARRCRGALSLAAFALSFSGVLQAAASLSAPSVSPGIIFVNTPTLCTVRVQIAPDPALIVQSVNLVRSGPSGASPRVVGRLFDDATSGDAVAGDGLFTGTFSFTEATAGSISFYATAASRGQLTRIQSPAVQVDVTVPPTPGQIDAAIRNQAFAKSLLPPGTDPAPGLAILRTTPGVTDAGLSPDGVTVWIEYAGGLGGLISRFPVGTLGQKQIASRQRMGSAALRVLSPAAAAASVSFPGSQNYIGLYPFADSTPDNSATISQQVGGICGGPTFTTLKNGQVLVDTFKNLGAFGVINVLTHGFQTKFGESAIATREAATTTTLPLHLPDLVRDSTGRRALYIGNLKDDPVAYFAIAPLFIDRYYAPGSLPDTAVFVSGCESLRTNALADAFFRAGANVYLGWDGAVTQVFAANAMVNLFSELSMPVKPEDRTIQKALEQIDTTDPGSPAELKAAGLTDMAICAPFYVRLNPFGTRSFSDGPFRVEALDSNLMPLGAAGVPRDITVTLRRRVISQCRGVIFDSNRTVVIPQGGKAATYDFTAGRDPACNTLEITTELTVTEMVFNPGKPLDLSVVPADQLRIMIQR